MPQDQYLEIYAHIEAALASAFLKGEGEYQPSLDSIVTARQRVQAVSEILFEKIIEISGLRARKVH